MEAFEFVIPFEKKREESNTLQYLNFLWRKNLTMGSASIVIGILIYFREVSNLSVSVKNGSMVFGFILVLMGVYFFVVYFLSRKKTKERMVIMEEQMSKTEHPVSFVNNDSFGIRNSTIGDFSLAWNPFTTCVLWKDMLIIYHYGKGSSALLIAKNEIGDEAFNRVVKAVKTKVANLKNEVV